MDHFYSTFLLDFALFGAWLTLVTHTFIEWKKKYWRLYKIFYFAFHKIKKVILVLEWHDGEQMMASLKITSPQNNQSPWSISLLYIVFLFFSPQFVSVSKGMLFPLCGRCLSKTCQSKLWFFNKNQTLTLQRGHRLSNPD